jgi:hemoglobin
MDNKAPPLPASTATLFDRLGGTEAVRAAVDGLYRRLLADPYVSEFFQDIWLPRLKLHQIRFMKVAFTVVPADFNVPDHIYRVHERLIRDRGVNETHFDRVAAHFVAALQELNVPPLLIDEAVAVIAPLRTVFSLAASAPPLAVEGAEEATTTTKKREKKHEVAAVVGTAASLVYPQKQADVADEVGKLIPPAENAIDSNTKVLKNDALKNNAGGGGCGGSSEASTRDTLFSRLGGFPAVKAVVEELYNRLLADDLTRKFFESVSITHLKQHQVKFLKIALSQIPDDLDVPKLLTERHMRLFLTKGLNETHFDRVAEHFVGACKHLGVHPDLIDEAVGVIGPLRPVFEEGAKLYGKR